jgi:hypothetical protein
MSRFHLVQLVTLLTTVYLHGKGDVDIIVKEDGASCTNPCTSFVCTANQTNILRIFQDGIRCISFQRNVDTHHNTCPGLSIEEKIADPDPTNEALSTFAVQAKQCFDGETNMVNIECVDAKLSSKALNITSKYRLLCLDLVTLYI